MKKLFITLVTILVLASSVNADMLKVEGGLGSWVQGTSGLISYTDKQTSITATDNSSEDDFAQSYAWIYIKHFVPILPNIRLEYVGLENKGKISGANGNFKNFKVPVGAFSNTTLSMTQYDVIPYYNLLDNLAWITLDLGLDIKVIDMTYEAQAVDMKMNLFASQTNYSEAETVVLPLLYLRARVQIPVTNIGIEADAKYIAYDGNTVYDIRAKVDYTFDITPLIQPAIELGYRVQKFNYDDDDAIIDLTFAGIYAGAYLRF